jgi:hypothetical protein
MQCRLELKDLFLFENFSAETEIHKMAPGGQARRRGQLVHLFFRFKEGTQFLAQAKKEQKPLF